MRPAHSPPATAAITTASMKSAIEISGLAGASGKATTVAIAGVSTPMKTLLSGELRGALGLVLLAHDHDTLAAFTGSSRLGEGSFTLPSRPAPEDATQRNPSSESNPGGRRAPSSCRTSGSVLIIRARLCGPELFPGPSRTLLEDSR